MTGTESDVASMISATSSMKTVRESSTVIPVERRDLNVHCDTSLFFSSVQVSELLTAVIHGGAAAHKSKCIVFLLKTAVWGFANL